MFGAPRSKRSKVELVGIIVVWSGGSGVSGVVDEVALGEEGEGEVGGLLLKNRCETLDKLSCRIWQYDLTFAALSSSIGSAMFCISFFLIVWRVLTAFSNAILS